MKTPQTGPTKHFWSYCSTCETVVLDPHCPFECPEIQNCEWSTGCEFCWCHDKCFNCQKSARGFFYEPCKCIKDFTDMKNIKIISTEGCGIHGKPSVIPMESVFRVFEVIRFMPHKFNIRMDDAHKPLVYKLLRKKFPTLY